MKTLNVKYSLVPAALLLLAFMGNRAMAQTVAPTASAVTLQQEKTELNNFIGSVRYERNRIDMLEKKYRSDKKSGNDLAAIEDQRQLTKAEGDLAMSKSYVKADKKMIIARHNLAIAEQKSVVLQDKKMLAKSKSGKNTADVTKYQAALDKDKQALRDRRVAKNDEVLAMNKKIRKQDGQFIGTLYAENALASTKNLIQK